MTKPITAEELDRMVDAGEDVTDLVVADSICQPGKEDEPRKVNGTMPSWLVDELDIEARHLAVSRQAVINMWLAEKAEDRRRTRTLA
ncbi:type II toxin-antitoxin system BrnA family antitoxin [Gordonibacter sp. 28C]|uniref:type II toxin-antitoxin system BrnA family antitoxin n=1 Tax=Gordonibacter sp. 28C TaxID=2078569 RepID=UPI001F546926|nr:CopG family transcriptional regulator [Gordonibacter sp. 28C]